MALVAGACRQDPAIPAVDLQLSIQAPDEPVAFGKAFGLRVERVWRADLQPEPWDDGKLAPLVVTTDRVQAHSDGDRHLEVRWLQAHAFGLPQVAVRDLVFEATAADGSTRSAVAEDLVIAVQSSLAGQDKGFETPEPLAPEPGGSALWWLLAIPAAAGLALVGLRRLWRQPEPTPAAPDAEPSAAAAPDAAATAMQALGNVDPDDPVGAHLHVDTVVRHYLEARFAWPALQRTTLEVLVPTANAGLAPGAPGRPDGHARPVRPRQVRGPSTRPGDR